jgi:phage head maturation protease
MNKLFEQFTEDIKGKFTEAFAKEDFTDFMQKTKAAADSGNFKVIISTPAVDRQGDSVDQNLWDLNNYLNNPVVLWGHDYFSLPIGIATSIEKQIVENQVVLVAEGKFAPAEANPFAQQVRALYEAGMVRATSVGFIPASMRMDGQGEK